MMKKKVHNAEILAHYLAKYFVKSANDIRYRGKRLYFSSRGIERPYLLYNEKVDKYFENDNMVVASRSYYRGSEGDVLFLKFKQNES